MKTEKLRPEHYDCFSPDDQKTIVEGDFTAQERAAIASHNANVKAERVTLTAIRREEPKLISAHLAARAYPIPDLSAVLIRPHDPWADLPPGAATSTTRRAHPLGAAPEDWTLLKRETRELLAGLVSAIVGAFGRDSARALERRDSMRGAIGAALALAREDETGRVALREALDPRSRAVVDALKLKLDYDRWSRVLRDVDRYYLRQHDLIFTLIDKFDQETPGILDRAVAALLRSLRGEPEPAPPPKPRQSSWESTREAERTAEAAAEKILTRGERGR